MTRSFFLPSLIVLALAGCGGAQPEPPQAPAAPTSTPPTPTATAEPVGAPAAWKDDLTKEQKMAFMKATIQPRMSKVFQGHDNAKYAQFGCKTCHGPNWESPKAFLPKLTFSGGKMTSPSGKDDVAKFMHEKVVPEMAAAFGKQPYDPKTNTGFGCGGCHAIEMK